MGQKTKQTSRPLSRNFKPDEGRIKQEQQPVSKPAGAETHENRIKNIQDYNFKKYPQIRQY